MPEHRPAPPDGRLPRAAPRGAPRGAPLLGRPRHVGDAQVDPGRVRRRGRGALRRPGAARRRLRRRAPEGARPGRGGEPGGRRQGGVRPRLRRPGDPGQRPLPGRLPALHRARPARCWPSWPSRPRAPTAPTPSPTAARARATTRCASRRRSRRSRPSSRSSRRCASGRWAATRRSPTRSEHGIPVSSTVERPYSIDDNLWGRSSEGGVIEDLDQAAARGRLPAGHPAPAWRPTAPRSSSSASATGCRSSLDGEELGLVELIRRVAEVGCAQRRGHRGPRRGPGRGPEGA